MAEFVDQPVDPFGGDPGLDLPDQHVQALGREPARLAHAREGGGAVDLDLAGFAQRRAGRIDIGHDRWRNRWRAISLQLAAR